MCNHIEAHPQADEIRDALKEIFSYQDLKDIEDDLRDILKADIGNDLGAGERQHIVIGYKLGTVTLVLTFLRKFPLLLNSMATGEHAELIEIEDDFQNIDYNEVDAAFFRGLNQWIYQDEDQETACIDYIARISAIYKSVVDLLTLCNSLYLNLRKQKGGASC